MIGSLLWSSSVDGTVPARLGNRSDRYAPQGVYRCAGTDDWCALCVESDHQWKILTVLIGQEQWHTDQRFESVSGRIQCHDAIDRAISSWTGRYSNKEVELRLRTAGISAARVRRIDEVLESSDPSAVFTRMSERRVGSMLTTKLPFTLSFVDLPEPYSAPALGEHSLEVLRGWLHCSDAEIDDLKRQEALQ
jgi:crotonobetainyl-CoA:carnitine CoA-transferase CaiB-like acyl-CoA transferase